MATAPRIRVLVVEDDPDLRDMMVDVLGLAGMSARGVAGARTARVALRDQPVDVVTLDLGLADGDGIELARELSGRATDRPRLLGVTGRAEEDVRAAALVAGCAAVLVKPVWPDALVREIEALRTGDR